MNKRGIRSSKNKKNLYRYKDIDQNLLYYYRQQIQANRHIFSQVINYSERY